MIAIAWLVITMPIALFCIFLFIAWGGQYDASLNWLKENDVVGNVLLIAIPLGILIGTLMLIFIGIA